MTAQWYVLRSKPHKEDALYELSLNRGYEVYYPQLRVKPVNPRSRSVRPFFPGYLFLHEDIGKEGRSTFNWMPFSNGLVTFGNVPGTIPDSIVQALKRRIDEINNVDKDPTSNWKKGDELVIRDGPFSGSEAIFDTHLSGHQRARILMKFISGNWVKTEIDIASLDLKAKD